MSEMNMFEVAVRSKFRFPFRGQVSVEDLFDLSVDDLDSVFKILNSQVKQAKEESLLTKKSAEDEILDFKIDIVKYIVNSKLLAKEAAQMVAEKRAQKQKIQGILYAKQNQELENKSTEELEKMLAELE